MELFLLNKRVRRALIAIGVLLPRATLPAAPSAPAPEAVENSVLMRSWSRVGAWNVVLARTYSDGPICAISAVGGQSGFRLRAKADPYGSLKLEVDARSEVLASQSIKVWIDGFLLGDFPVTRRLQSSGVSSVYADVPESEARTLIDLFGTGGWISYRAGQTVGSVSLQTSDTALKSLLECTRELGTLNSVGATADVDEALHESFIQKCTRVLTLALQQNLSVKCQIVWDHRADLPKFAELNASLDAAQDAASSAGILSELDRVAALPLPAQDAPQLVIGSTPSNGSEGSTLEVHARYILVDDEATAKKIIADLKKGGDFTALSKQYSKDSAAVEQGGDLGYFKAADMVPEFSAAAFALKDGEISPTPVHTEFGWNVIQTLDRRNVPNERTSPAQSPMGEAPLTDASPQPMSPNSASTEATVSQLRQTQPGQAAPEMDRGWVAAVSAWLAAHRTYPAQARERDEEGNVSVRFTVDRSGRVVEAVIVKPSGSALLDEAALGLLRQAVFPAFPADMTQARTTITTTLRYSRH
jgi:TonB family protein